MEAHPAEGDNRRLKHGAGAIFPDLLPWNAAIIYILAVSWHGV
jgi:hypothetical protein